MSQYRDHEGLEHAADAYCSKCFDVTKKSACQDSDEENMHRQKIN